MAGGELAGVFEALEGPGVLPLGVFLEAGGAVAVGGEEGDGFRFDPREGVSAAEIGGTEQLRDVGSCCPVAEAPWSIFGGHAGLHEVRTPLFERSGYEDSVGNWVG
jgi:hypothetical protein